MCVGVLIFVSLCWWWWWLPLLMVLLCLCVSSVSVDVFALRAGGFCFSGLWFSSVPLCCCCCCWSLPLPLALFPFTLYSDLTVVQDHGSIGWDWAGDRHRSPS
uniref:Uncharacterized protein n=1 Tax=Anopheles darlingi TaxID=43151 RepID=A0A2M4DL64_ANODA